MKQHRGTSRRLALPAIGLLLVASGCGFFQDAGPQTTQERSIEGVTAVRLLTSGELTITTGRTQTLTVTAGANQLVGLTSQVLDGALILDNKAQSVSGDTISYALTVPPLDSLELSGSGSAQGDGVLQGDADLTVSGSGSANLTGVTLTSVVVNLSGSGNVQLGGRAMTQRVTISGSGNYDGSALSTEQADVEVNGSGSARVDVTGRLSATVAGSGDITYSGNPSQVDRASSGSGEIIPG